MPKLEPASDWGLWALSDLGWAAQAKMRKKCCYGWGRSWVNIAVRPCLHSFLTHNKHHPFENKVWEIYISIKKCIRSLLKSFITDCLFRCIFLYVYVQYYALQHKRNGGHLEHVLKKIHPLCERHQIHIFNCYYISFLDMQSFFVSFLSQ